MKRFQSICVFLVCLATAPTLATTNSTEEQEVNSRIVGGHIISVGEAPYIVQLRYRNGGLACGGTLVTPQYVVTAAHCLDFIKPKQDLVVIGGVGSSTGKGENRVIVDFFTPQLYSRKTFHMDVAVLKLGSAMPIGNNIKTVPLCTKPLQPDDVIKVSGWGRKVTNGPMSQRLHTIRLPIISDKQCSKRFHLTRTMVCGAKATKGPCQGDSGGPVMHGGQLCAIVSWGRSDCVYDGSPAVYTSIDAVRSFIERSLQK